MDDPVVKAEGVTGVHPGMFRVEVSMLDSGGNETILAKYNTQTTLGCDVGLVHRMHRGGVIRLKLSSR